MSNRRTKLAAATAVAAAIVASGFAFTASNTVPASRAGDGAGTVSGYVVDSVHYTLDAADPTQVDAVEFDLDATPVAGSTVRAKLAAASTTWYSCTWSGTAVSCATTAPQAVVSAIDELRVVIAD